MDLTLVICLYNAEKYIEKTLLSIINQTYKDFYLLIINDCSTDDSIQTLEFFFKNHPRQYELVNFKQNQGIAFARNYALHTAKTKYLIFVDSDDLPLPQLLEKEYALLTSDQELMAVSSWLEYIDKRDSKIGGGLFIGDTDKNAFKQRAERKKLIFLPIQTMFKREYAIRAGGFCCTGFPEGKPRYRDYCEDLDLWTRMSDFYSEGQAIVTIPEVLYQYRKADSLSSNHFNMIIKMRYVKKNLLLRRNKQKELTFIEFANQLSKKEINRLKKESKSADCLRNGVFHLRSGNVLKGSLEIAKSFWYKPSYLFDKIKSNFRLKK